MCIIVDNFGDMCIKDILEHDLYISHIESVFSAYKIRLVFLMGKFKFYL